MAITRVQQNSGVSSVAGTVTVTYGSTPTQNNLLIATVYSSVQKSTLSITGWLLADSENDSSNHSVGIFYKVAGASESTSVVVNSTASGSIHVVIMEYSGLDSTNPFDKSVVNTSAASAVNSLSTGTTASTSNPNELLIAVGGIAGAASSPTYTNSFTNVLSTSRNQTCERIVSSTSTYETTIGFTGTAVLMNAVLATFQTTPSNPAPSVSDSSSMSESISISLVSPGVKTVTLSDTTNITESVTLIIIPVLLISVSDLISSSDGMYSYDHALWFDGQSDYTTINDSDVFSQPTTGELTISFWMRLDAFNFPVTTASGDGPYVDFLGKGRYGPNEYEWTFRVYDLNSTRPNRISFYIFNENAGIGVGSYVQETVVLGQWINITGKVDTSNTYMYKNGVLKDQDTWVGTITPVNTTTPVRVGSTEINTTGDPCYFLGAIKGLRFYNRALTDTEVLNIYNGNPTSSGLTAYYPFLEGSGLISADASGNGNTMTLASNPNTPVWVSQSLAIAETLIVRVSDISVVSSSFSSFLPTLDIGTYGPLSTLKFRSIDAMKITKDNVTSQPSDAFIDSYTAFVAANLNVTCVALDIPFDINGDFIANSSTPSPRTITAYMQKWADSVHNSGKSILWRPTLCGLEGIYNFTPLVGSNRLAAGTAASAPTDGQTTLLGKTNDFIKNNPTLFKTGDIWAPFPESTSHNGSINVFSDSTAFLPNTGPGIQANYTQFFADVQTVANAQFLAMGKNVFTGYTANNWSEINSGWLNSGNFSIPKLTAFDDYGSTHTVSEMQSHYDTALAKGFNIFHEEWSDYWDVVDDTTKLVFLASMYTMMGTYSLNGKEIGFNSWSGWSGSVESSFTVSGTTWGFTPSGQVLQWAFSGGMNETTVISESVSISIVSNTRAINLSMVNNIYENFNSYTINSPYTDGTVFGIWTSQFNGFGTNEVTQISGNNVLYEKPLTPVGSATHSSLVTSNQSFSGDMFVQVDVTTISQLRSPTPNAWERAWVMWNYTDNTHFYYFTVKSTGWELGKEDPAYPGNQRFLATGSSPTYAVGLTNTFKIVQIGTTISVYVNGSLITTFTDAERPYTSGQLGLYNEDSEVTFDNVIANNLPTGELIIASDSITIQNVLLISVNETVYVSEQDGTCLIFDGSTTVVKKSIPVTNVTNNYTMMAWFKAKAVGGAIVSNGIDDGVSNFNGYSIVFSGGVIGATFNGINNLSSGISPGFNIWTHVAVVRNSGTTRIYVNGVDSGVTSTQTPAIPTGFTTVGSDVNGAGTIITSKTFNGSIDKVIIFSRAISATEISNYYNNIGLLDSTSMVLDWEFNDATGTSAIDSSPIGTNTGTVVNPNWASTGDAPYSNINFNIPSLLSVSDTTVVSENSGILQVIFISVSDNTTVSDSVSMFGNIQLNVSDTTIISESINENIPVFLSVSDTSVITELSSTTLVLLIFITLSEKIDQQNLTGATGIGFGDTGSGRDYMVQGFIPTSTQVTAVAFYVNSKDGSSSVGYRVWIDTCDSNSNPTNGVGGIGGSTLITNAQLVTSGLTKYTLTTPVTVVPGNRYVMAFAPWNTNTNVWANSYHDWISATTNPYANGRRVHLNSSYASPSAPDSGLDDILFTVYGIFGEITTMSDNTSDIEVSLISVSDTTILSDSNNQISILYISVFDNVSIFDFPSISRVGSPPTPSIFDTTVVTELSSVFIPTLTNTLTDTIAVTESVLTFIPILTVSVSETVVITEVIIFTGTVYIVVSDINVITDIANISITILAFSVFDTTQISDITVFEGQLNFVVFDSTTLSETNNLFKNLGRVVYIHKTLIGGDLVSYVLTKNNNHN